MQSIKAQPPMVETMGKVISFKLSQLAKAYPSIVSALSNSISFKLEQWEKAYSSTVVAMGTETFSNCLLPAKVPLPIFFNLGKMIVFR